MSIANEIQKLSPSAIVELFVLDATNMPDGERLYFHAGTNQLTQPVVWQGVSYQPFPIEAEGFDKSTQGSLPRPKMRVANVDGMISALLAEEGDLVGCSVIRKRTFVRYLDAVNFIGGNPDADPNQHFVDEKWWIEQKVSESFHAVEWELSSVFDLMGVQLPTRQVLQNSCTAKRYRGPDCGYTGTLYFDRNDQPCSEANDNCAKRLVSCKLRHPTGPIPFGGFPGARRYEG